MSTISTKRFGKNIKPKLWIVSEVFYPEEVSTGYILTKLAEGLAEDYDVRALSKRKSRNIVPSFETYKGVKIYRCLSTVFNKNNLFLRFINAFSFNILILFNSLIVFSRNDLVMAVTNPPILPYFVLLGASVKKATFIILVHDVYPHLMVALDMIKPTSFLFRLWTYFNKILFEKSNLIVVLSEDMKKLVSREFYSSLIQKKIHVIQNWAEIDIIKPFEKENNSIARKLGINDKFIIQYAGNFGRPNDIETIIDAAKVLKCDEKVHFIFAGDGAKKKWVEKQKSKFNLDNLTLLNSYSRKDQNGILSASDISLIALIRGMKGISMPSRFYNIMASGKAIIAIIDDNTEVASIIKNEGIGWVIPPGNGHLLINAILEAKIDPYLKEKGLKARKIAEKNYSYDKILSMYKVTFEKLNE